MVEIQWVVIIGLIAVLIGVILGMIIGIALSRPSLVR